MALMQFDPGTSGGGLVAPEDATEEPDDTTEYGGDGEAASSVEEQEEFLAKGDVANDIRSQVTEGGMDTPVRDSTDADTNVDVTTVREDGYVGVSYGTDAESGGEDDQSSFVLDTRDFAEDDDAYSGGGASDPRDTIDTTNEVVNTVNDTANESTPTTTTSTPDDQGEQNQDSDGVEVPTFGGLSQQQVMLGAGALIVLAVVGGAS